MKTMRLWRHLVIAVFGLAISQGSVAGDIAPVFALPTDKGAVSLSDLKGKVVYLDFWASWCTPCRKSFPWMNEMQRRYGAQGLTVVAVNVDKDRELAGKFLTAVPADFTVVYDPTGKVAESFQVKGMPASYLIDRAGRVQVAHLGFREDDKSDLESALKLLLVR